MTARVAPKAGGRARRVGGCVCDAWGGKAARVEREDGTRRAWPQEDACDVWAGKAARAGQEHGTRGTEGRHASRVGAGGRTCDALRTTPEALGRGGARRCGAVPWPCYSVSGTRVGVARVRVSLRKNSGDTNRIQTPATRPSRADTKAMTNTPPMYQCGQNGISHDV
jgi:hypothetical protein